MQIIKVQELEFGSPEQIESLNLRYKVLREPLGLHFEQSDLDLDGEDFHIAAFINHELVGILLLKPFQALGYLKMRQVAVNENSQGKGIGKAMVRYSENFAIVKGFKKIVLNARRTAIPFYVSLGYSGEGETFFEVGIPHKKMIKTL